MKAIATIFLFLCSLGLFSQSVLRNPDTRKDWVNVFYNSQYTLFDLWSDEPIFPDSQGIYHIYHATNENKTPVAFSGNESQLSKLAVYKFKNLENCRNWCNGVVFVKSNSYQDKNSNSQANTSNKTGSPCISGDCNNGYGKFQNPHSIYEGYFLNGKMHGKGTNTWTDGRKYIGDWLNGERNGKGTMSYADGSKYTGDWINSKKKGKGTMSFPDGRKYTGDWLNGNAHGKGTLIKSDGTTLTGDFVDGNYIEQQKPKEEKLVIEPASIGAKWSNGDANQQGMSSLMLLSSNKGVLSKTGNTTFTFKWENAKKEVKTEYLTLKSSKEGMCQLSALFAQEKCKISEYTIKGNSDRKAIINWYSGKRIDVLLYNDFGEFIGSWDLTKE